MTSTANLASAAADADHAALATDEPASFVLNLCSSTTPMALAQTDLPELKRFTFFVSRRFEEGRERFRLHMGFFASQAEAEEWLGVVREIYPGAWAGEAPGKKLRARAAEAAAAQARHAVGPQRTAAAVPAASVPAPAAAPVPAAPAVPRLVSARPAPAPQMPKVIPTIHPPRTAAAKAPTPAAAAARTASAPRTASLPLPSRPSPQGPAQRPAVSAAARATTPLPAAPRATPTARASAAPAQARGPAAPSVGQRPAPKASPARPARPVAAGPSASAKPAAAAATRPAAQTAARPTQPSAKKPVFANSNVKEVLAALDEPEDATGETRLMPSLAGAEGPADDSSLTDTQVLRFLETRQADDGRGASPAQADVAAASGISLLKPDDTGTRRALKQAVSHNEPVSFAVQLQWSVQPVELDKVPPLAIFSAYTLYSVEGSREGRRWYGLRLGFFNDAISAKQVAFYVRSEFASVAVVPVSSQERERATEDQQRFSGAGGPRPRGATAGMRRLSEDDEFKLIDSDHAPEAARKPAGGAPAPAPARAAAPSAPSRSPGKSTGKVGARERRTPQTLEETLEILGANELAIDNGSDASLSDTGVRHLRVEIQKNTPFSRLLERLSERVRKA